MNESGFPRWLGSFRVRVFLLITLVAVSAVGLTAWLTARQATDQINSTVNVEKTVTDQISGELTNYATHHGTWEGVPSLVQSLNASTGQRIRLTTSSGEVIVDSDHLRGDDARAVPNAPVAVLNPRPILALADNIDGRNVVENALSITSAEIDTYRRGVLLAACLTRQGLPVQMVNGPYGVPRYKPVTIEDRTVNQRIDACEDSAITPAGELAGDADLVNSCLRADVLKPYQDGASTFFPPSSSPPTTAETLSPEEAISSAAFRCLEDSFAARTEAVAPVSLLLYLGVQPGDSPVRLQIMPVLAVAALVALAAIGSTVILSRRVLRPIDSLIHASRQLGSGDLSERVPVTGRDELADLATAFNRMAESLEQSEARQRRMVADIAHELRTPLANVRGYLEALSDGVLEPTPELFASLHEEAVLQQRIVSDLQDLALAESGRMVYHRGPMDLAELAETCRAAHLAVAESEGVELRAISEGPARVQGDPDRLRQAIGNLVSNAVRATPAGGSVVLSTRIEDQDAILEVTDTGHGIASEDLPHIFDRFWRADASRGRATGGSGLGLAIAREIIVAHEGTIEARSVVEVGTTFTVTLPLMASP